MRDLINPKFKNCWLYIIVVIFMAFFVVGGVLFYQQSMLKEVKENQITHSRCLANDEIATYEMSKEGIAREMLKIFIKDQISGREQFSFQIDNVSKAVHAIEMYKCNIYVIKVFNYDDKRGVPLPDYRTELWRFHYNGEGEKLIDLFKKEGVSDNYGQDFRIDSTETYLILERSYLGNPNYALVIKDLKTKEDIFVFPLKEIIAKYPNLEGSIGLNGWTKDGKYFWGDIFYGANVLAFFRIERDAWKYEIFPAPKDVLGGDTLNVEKGYITIHPGAVWFGIVEFTEEEKTKRRAQGIGTELYIENLITGNRYFIDKTDEPLWFFKPKWLSDTELEYTLPTGEKKIYKIEEE